MKLRKCLNHAQILYTLKDICLQCKKPTQDAHYKFIRLRDAKEHAEEKADNVLKRIYNADSNI